MAILDDLKKTLTDFSSGTADPEDLERLQQFLKQMKDAGIAKTREYDIPQPDTIGRAMVDARRKAT